MKTLLLYASYTNQMSYFDDWNDAFRTHKNFKADCVNVLVSCFSDVKKKIETYDLVVLHHSMNGDTLKYLHPFTSILKNRKCKLVSFVGNEVNLPTLGMYPKIKLLQEIKPEIILTQLLQEAGEWLYQECKSSKVLSLPHALNPKVFFQQNNQSSRKIDIGTRSARYGVYIGDDDRNRIIQFFHAHAQSLDLSVDLGLEPSAQKRFKRQEWAHFLNSCKATLSTEAGSFYLQRDDELVNKIQSFLKKKSSKIILPHETLTRKIYQQIVPQRIRRLVISVLQKRLIEIDALDEGHNFEEIYNNFFLPAQKCSVYSKAISSRHFDAIGAHTLHIMYPGRYNDILTPHEHYLELKKDHSNIAEVIESLRNNKLVKRITDNAFDHVISNHTHEHRLDRLLQHLR